jgi:hypothetical protein
VSPGKIEKCLGWSLTRKLLPSQPHLRSRRQAGALRLLVYVCIYISVCVWLVRNSINTGSRPPPKSASHLLWPTPAKVSGTWSSYGLHGLQGQKSMMAPSCKARKDVHVQPMAEALQSLPSHSRAILSLGAIGTYGHWWSLRILWNCSWLLQVIVATRWTHNMCI